MHARWRSSVVDSQGGTEAGVNDGIDKAMAAFLPLENIQTIFHEHQNHDIKILNANVKAVTCYGAETWRTTVATTMRPLSTAVKD